VLQKIKTKKDKNGRPPAHFGACASLWVRPTAGQRPTLVGPFSKGKTLAEAPTCARPFRKIAPSHPFLIRPRKVSLTIYTGRKGKLRCRDATKLAHGHVTRQQ
jgi:hypothetical protein